MNVLVLESGIVLGLLHLDRHTAATKAKLRVGSNNYRVRYMVCIQRASCVHVHITT